MERVMELRKTSPGTLLLVGVLMGLMASSGAYDFNVGGRDGWVSNPSETYDKWAGRNRFQVNDTLVFRYRKEVDSVLVVTKQDYDACNASNPIQKLEGGDSTFKFDRSGPFYFISGVPESCRKGQKLAVVVLAIRNQNPSPPPPSSPPFPHSIAIAISLFLCFPLLISVPITHVARSCPDAKSNSVTFSFHHHHASSPATRLNWIFDWFQSVTNTASLESLLCPECIKDRPWAGRYSSWWGTSPLISLY